MPHEAAFYQSMEGQSVRCTLCPRNCLIPAGKHGYCNVRQNQDGILFSLNYGKCSAVALDPIEKKPLYHFYPGHNVLSVGSLGCNLHCSFCQNWSIAQQINQTSTRNIDAEQLVEAALKLKHKDDTCVGIAYTYSEPGVWYEYVYDTARLAKLKRLANVLVTNGFLQVQPLLKLLPYIDAVNIDVKSFTEDFYRNYCAGYLSPVLLAVEAAYGHCHLEVTTLLVTGLNDTEEEIERLTGWLAGVDPYIPLHFSRYYPNYRLQLPPTPLETLIKARELALKKLKFVYIGNASELNLANTFCPKCGRELVVRQGYRVETDGLREGRCVYCGAEVCES